ncbi:replicative DNA helicase [Campylobacter sp. 19-13652]|uniref:replicative DNA helicase n=1 Tax=Campylobacter sp. 19-13652 TaxID=2840180 RepID=UPI001C75566E|nr:replicative DNA helicase [Campylobacter sp. 19-13652]BCX79521.1 replicative DNA helicase [Campylobacter sp. 19-13652]
MSVKNPFEIDYANLYDMDMERAILSSILVNNDLYGEISDMLGEKDFYHRGHSEIYRAMGMCVASEEPIATNFIKNKLGERFDTTLMADILSTNPIVDIQKYADDLHEKSIKRELIKVASKVPSKVSEDARARDMIDGISQEIYALVEGAQAGSIRDSADIIKSLNEYLAHQASLENSDMIGVSSGFRGLDNMTKGFKPGDLIVLAARPAMGKTTLCLNFVSHALRRGEGVVFFSLEMPAEQIMARILSSLTSIPLQTILTAKMDDEEISRLSDACSDMAERKFYVYDSGYVNIHQIRSQMRKLKMLHPEINLCVIDYIGLMTSTSSFSDRHLQIAEISRGLKLLARELDMPIIALSQLNRSLESRANKRPMLSDLRESGAIEQDADLILFVYRDEVYREQEEREKEKRAKAEGKDYTPQVSLNKLEEEAEIIIGKNRNGPIGTVEVIFQKEFTRFENKSGLVQATDFVS